MARLKRLLPEGVSWVCGVVFSFLKKETPSSASLGSKGFRIDKSHPKSLGWNERLFHPFSNAHPATVCWEGFFLSFKPDQHTETLRPYS